MNQIQFDDTYSFGDWGIYLSSYSIGDAEPKENYVDIPSGDGSIDLTEALTGETKYGDRQFEAVFTIKPPRKDWPLLLRKINAYLNGKKRIIRVADEPDYYLIGRCKTSFEKEGVLGFLTVTATCQPYKYKNITSVYNLKVSDTGVLEVDCTNSRKKVIPVITVDNAATLEFGNGIYALKEGSYKYTSIKFVEGKNRLTIKGPAGTSVKIEYQEGAL